MLQFLYNQQQLKVLRLYNDNLPSNLLIQAISAVELSPSVNTLKELFLDGNSFEDEATWESIATFISKARNLVKLEVEKQSQERKLMIQEKFGMQEVLKSWGFKQ